jgi:predicted transposase YbfD/YdcC
MAVADKSNEIVAIPKLLDLLQIEGAIVTIDAMGCQREIARKIVDKKADYILALKGNQGSLREDAELFADEQIARDFADTTVSRAQTVDGEHGRIETRTLTVMHDVDWLRQRHDWPGLTALAMLESVREIAGKVERERRFYITSSTLPAACLAPAIRDHWSIENSLHWVMDMVFRDDDSRLRNGNAPANVAAIRHMAQNLIRARKGTLSKPT